ncbi:MFS general substrate transporter [Aulographum hederae CBS 113979]|uniref:MFS general substrate transporter n=1 Tax=Aulographum hederae CBS 113979 TaxID=1176131 RepID=A0A6G1GZX8_9PEZI|nr:MFS general substrate transporter [Aulographum hederae CBS 113979]
MDDKEQGLDTRYVEEVSSRDSLSPSKTRSEEETRAIEKRIARKFDKRVLPCGVLIYLVAFIDRSNMGNARLLGLEEDLDLVGNRFNIALTAFFCTYIVFEVPCNMMCKKLGSRWWLGILTTGFGLMTMCLAFVQSYHSLIAVRALLGIFEAGVLPGIVYTFSQFYRRHEIASRLGVQSSTASLAGSFGGLLAIGLSSIPAHGMLHSWRYIFLIEGIISMLVGFFVFATLPSTPAEAKFLTEEEREVACARIIEEHMTKVEDPFSLDVFKKAVFHIPAQLIGLGLICSLLNMNSIAIFMPTLLSSMNFGRIESQLLTVPPYILSATVCVCTAILSDRIKRRGIILCVLAPLIVVGFAILAGTNIQGVKYFGIFLATSGAFSVSPLLLTWSVDNAAGPSVRAIVSAYTVGLGNFGSLIATWTFVHADAPRFLKGVYINLGFASLLVVTIITLTLYLSFENKKRNQGRRDSRIDNLSQHEIDLLGHRHPNFRFTV